MESHGPDGSQHLPGPTLWPVGFAVGIAVLLVGVILGWEIVAIGAVITAIFGFLWIRDVTREMRGEPEPKLEPEPPPARERRRAGAAPEPGEGEEIMFPRSRFLEGATLGLGAVIGGIVTLLVIGFAGGPAFVDQGHPDVDVGPVDDFPIGQYVITTFLLDPDEGEVSRRTAYVRRNPDVDGVPSFTPLSSRCVHLGCPVQVNGLPLDDQAETQRSGDTVVRKIPTAAAAGFGCPCHGGQYDTEGNRTAGPPVRALDRYEFKVANGRLLLGKTYSVASVDGEAQNAEIHSYKEQGPGQHVDGPEALLYPVQPPR